MNCDVLRIICEHLHELYFELNFQAQSDWTNSYQYFPSILIFLYSINVKTAEPIVVAAYMTSGPREGLLKVKFEKLCPEKYA